MKLFFDTEFTGLCKDTTLMSIGIIDEDGNTFYAELTDYDKSKVDDWIQKNVVNNFKLEDGDCYTMASSPKTYETNVCDTFSKVSEELNKWLSRYGANDIEFISDVCHYDGVLLMDLISNGKSVFDIPANIIPAIHDINQDIAAYCKCSSRTAFDLSREELAYTKVNADKAKHNALFDAKTIKVIYEKINKK